MQINLDLSWWKLGVLAAVYTVVIFGGGFVIRRMIKPYLESIPSQKEDTLKNAGLYIGMMERFLILTALLLDSPETAGWILTAKSIARFPEFSKAKFAEYFLMGTLMSICMAITGWVALLVLWGKVIFSTTNPSALPEWPE